LNGCRVTLLAILIVASTIGSQASARSERTTWSVMGMALAPNAGGQAAYSLRRATDQNEMGVFANTYLQAGNYPLLGAVYDWRFPLCGQECFWQFFAQAGVGLSTGGPLVELTWGTIPFWILRVDVTTHIIAVPYRAVTWSYPLWVGLSLPLW
jgi:hypothetical protein